MRRRRRTDDLTRILLRRRRWTRRSIGFALLAIVVTALLDHFGYFKYDGDDWKRFDQKAYVVRHVIDGDTVVVRDSTGNETHVRLLGIDAAEMHADGSAMPEYWARRATDYLESRVEGKTVTLRLEPTQTRDKYDRLLAYVYPSDSENLNLELVRAGQVYADRRFHHTLRGLFESTENEARKRSAGLWKDIATDQMPGWRRHWLEQRGAGDYPF